MKQRIIAKVEMVWEREQYPAGEEPQKPRLGRMINKLSSEHQAINSKDHRFIGNKENQRRQKINISSFCMRNYRRTFTIGVQ